MENPTPCVIQSMSYAHRLPYKGLWHTWPKVLRHLLQVGSSNAMYSKVKVTKWVLHTSEILMPRVGTTSTIKVSTDVRKSNTTCDPTPNLPILQLTLQTIAQNKVKSQRFAFTIKHIQGLQPHIHNQLNNSSVCIDCPNI